MRPSARRSQHRSRVPRTLAFLGPAAAAALGLGASAARAWAPDTHTVLSSAAECDSTGASARAILRLEDDWARALVKRDGATFRRLLAPEFVYSENDRTMDRDAVLKEVVSGSDTAESAHNEELCVHRFGTTTAAVTGWLVVRGRGANGPFDRRYRFTDTWLRRSGRWQIVAAHDYLAP